MKTFRYSIALFFAGCMGVQPVAGTLPSSPISASTSQGALIYATAQHGAEIFSYPDGKLVGALSIAGDAYGDCSDTQGDIFITAIASSGHGKIFEFAHGGTQPIAELRSGEGWAFACTVDPTTGNLVTNDNINTGPSFLELYQDAKGKPTRFSDPAFYNYYGMAYDDAGNLYVDGIDYQNHSAVAELAKGSSKFVNYALSLQGSGEFAGQMQLHGKLLAIEVPGGTQASILHVRLEHRTAKIVGTTTLRGADVRFYLLDDGTAIGTVGNDERVAHQVALWHYPAGGNPFKTFHRVKEKLSGLALSI
jgi:hypothetical protein